MNPKQEEQSAFHAASRPPKVVCAAWLGDWCAGKVACLERCATHARCGWSHCIDLRQIEWSIRAYMLGRYHGARETVPADFEARVHVEYLRARAMMRDREKARS